VAKHLYNENLQKYIDDVLAYQFAALEETLQGIERH
jgi:hypothetical protein